MSHTVVQEYQKKHTKKSVPVLKPGMTVKVTHKFREGDKERSQMFQGVIIKMHEESSLNTTFTVRKVVDGIGVEKIFPLHSPMIEIEVVRSSKVRRAKLYYLRERSGKSARLREKDKAFGEILMPVAEESTPEMKAESQHVEPETHEEVAMAEETVAAEAPATETQAEVVAETPETSENTEEKAA